MPILCEASYKTRGITKEESLSYRHRRKYAVSSTAQNIKVRKEGEITCEEGGKLHGVCLSEKSDRDGQSSAR